MAVNQRSLGDWQYTLQEPEGLTSRSPRRSTTSRSPRRSRTAKTNVNASSITMRRKTDGLEIKLGDHIIYQDPEQDPEEGDVNKIGLVVTLEFGIEHFIDMQVLCFDRKDELEVDEDTLNDVQEEEVFLTPINVSVLAQDVVDKTEILTKDSFDKLESEQKNNKYFCQRAVDEFSTNVTNAFNYTDTILNRLQKKGPKELLDFVRTVTAGNHTVKEASPKKKQKTVAPKPRKETIETQTIDSIDETESNTTETDEPELVDVSPSRRSRKRKPVVIDEEFSSSESDDSLDEFIPKVNKSKRGRKPKTQNASEPQTPKKYKKEVFSAKGLQHLQNRKEEYAASLDFIQKVVGNKQLRIKDKLDIPSFNAVSPKKRKQLDNPFELLDTKSGAFKDLKNKLHASTKLTSLPCREDEFTSLYLSIENAIREKTGCCLYVSGTPGIGKTATIREVMHQMKELQVLDELPEFDYHEINGLKLINPNDAYSELWGTISGLDVTSSNAANFLDAYFKEASPSKKPMVLMIDELDQIATKKQGVMYNFFNWPTYPESQLIVIAVANTMDLPERVLSNKISSRLGLKRIQFIGYSFEQLGHIIEHRLDLLTRQTKHNVIVDKDAINFASRKVASVSGDARRALQICRRAVEIAELDYKLELQQTNGSTGDQEIERDQDEEPSFHVKIPHIAKAINETINSPIAKYISSLSFASKLLLAALLLRMRRSGLSDNPLGDIIDEMKILLSMASSKHLVFDRDLDPSLDMAGVLLNDKLSSKALGANIRIETFRFLLFELVENGILTMQNIKTERYRQVSLNVSEEEVLTTLKRDPLVSSLL